MSYNLQIKKISFPGVDRNVRRGPCENLEAVTRDITSAKNYFCPAGSGNGPFELEMEIVEGKLGFHIYDREGNNLPSHYMSLNPYRRLIGDYYLLCDSYQDARKGAGPSRLEAIDMGRKALHNEGAGLLMERISHRIDMDLPTARKIFTIICVLYGRPPGPA
jgi:uncharacterized protein (UPF0262 family)